MPFKLKKFGAPIYDEEAIEEKKLVIIACEGSNTEFDYFNYIQNSLCLKAIVKMEILERSPDRRGDSAPTKVVEMLQNLAQEEIQAIKEKYGFEESFDMYWIVVDREKQESKKVNLEKALTICDEEHFNVAITNPCFEFWLLMHLKDIEDADLIEILENKKNKNQSRKRFLELEIAKLLNGSYNKANIREIDFISLDKIKKACDQEKNFENDPHEIVKKLGSNIGILVSQILSLD